MDSDKFKEYYNKYFNYFSNITISQKRLMLMSVYGSLYFRMKRDTESINIVSGAQFNEFMYPIDLYTKTGINKLKIPANSCFELKSTIVSDTLFRIHIFAAKYLKSHPGAKVYLLYQDKGMLTDQVMREAKKQRLVEIYQMDDFLNKTEKVAKLHEQIEKQERNWKEERESIIESAKFSYREDHCSFFLGAGVSMDAGGPSWDTLLRKILKRYKKIGKQKDFNKVYENCGMSPIILGRYVASNEKRLELIADYLRRYVLYKGVHIEKSELIKSVCEAIVGPEDNERIVASGSVESIITYNYDDLVETALEERGVPVARIYLKSRNKKVEFPVYHVHGIIPQKKQDIISTPILGEKEYHNIYRESYQWSNVEQLHVLDRNTCFFIGLSMTDPNLRRLLDISQSGSDKENRHYAFLQRKPLFMMDEVQKNEMHFRTIEYQLADLGVQVIWYEKHSEVPGFIRRIISPMSYVG